MSIHILATEHMTDLASRVYNRLKDKDFTYAEVEYVTFPSQEVKPRIPTTVRREHTYLFHSLHHPNPNDAMMKLLLTNDALSRGSAESITLVLQYMSYLRQDRKDEPRVPISARVMANLIETNPKVGKIITLDTHCDQIQGFYNIPVDNLYGSLVHAEYFRKKYGDDSRNLVGASPDYGGTKRTKLFAYYLKNNDEIGMINKQRSGDKSEQIEMLGYQGPPVKGKKVLVYDDMIDTAGTLVNSANALYEDGAEQVIAASTHGIFSRPDPDTTAEERLRKAGIQVVVTETIPRSKQYLKENADWLTMLPIDDLLAKAVLETSMVGGSVSSLFKR